MKIDPNHVSIAHAEGAFYPKNAPFHPSESYPEYPFSEVSDTPNYVYTAVRENLRLLGLDSSRYGTKDWNPLSDVIRPGQKVVLKPNMVSDFHGSGGNLDSIITHGSVVRAVLDYVYIALQGKGEVAVVDAPNFDASFERIIEHTGISEICSYYNEFVGFPVALSDLRVEKAIVKNGLVIERKKLTGDTKGYRVVSLGKDSAFYNMPYDYNHLRGSDYDIEETIDHHRGETHEYYVAGTILNSDVFVNIPKMKTHRKAGVTLCMKNLIGINGDKNWIPHFRIGGPRRGGDEFCSNSWVRNMESQAKDRVAQALFNMGPITRLLARSLRKVQKGVRNATGLAAIRGGGWYGNDTLWRAILDLNRICLYANSEGRMCDKPQRAYISFVDGIIAGEGTGPFDNLPVGLGVVIAGWDPVAVDIAAVDLMNFDYMKIPKVVHALENHSWPITHCTPKNIVYHSNKPDWGPPLRSGKTKPQRFTPPPGLGKPP